MSVLAQAQQEVAKEGLATDSTVYDAGLGGSSGDTTLLSNDSLLQSSIPPVAPKKETLDDRIEYSSTDSMVIMGNGVAHMYGSGELQYKAMKLTAEYIRMHMDSSTLYAKGLFDSIENEVVGKPVFSEGNDSYETSEITFNLKTQKAFIRNAVTEQGEGYVIPRKKVSFCPSFLRVSLLTPSMLSVSSSSFK